MSAFRDAQCLILEAAAGANPHSEDFGSLLASLDLTEVYRTNLLDALQAGRWRAAERPFEAIRKACLRAVFRRDDQGKSRKEVSAGFSPGHVAQLCYLADTKDAVRGRDGVWRRGGGREARYDEQTEAYDSPKLIDHIPRDLREVWHPPDWLRDLGVIDAREIADWNKIADRAGLDQWERQALEAMAYGFTRYAAMQDLDDAAERRALEAAWRRLERSKFAKIRAVLVAT